MESDHNSSVNQSIKPLTATENHVGWTSINWMKNLSSEVAIVQISIPGTHESAALYGPGFGFVGKCQETSIQQQLEMGVRYLDIRCHLPTGKDYLTIYHGIIDQKQTFQDILSTCNSFLQKNPSETIIMSIKQEFNAKDSKLFVEVFNKESNKYIHLFYKKLANSGTRIIPTLGEVRGKIIVLKKFEDLEKKCLLGIDFSGRPSNTTAAYPLPESTIGEQTKGQSVYEVGSAQEKISYFSPLLEESFSKINQTLTLYINNTSCYNKFTRRTGTIPDEMGKYLLATLKTKGKGNTGIIPMDFITPSYCNAIIETNQLK